MQFEDQAQPCAKRRLRSGLVLACAGLCALVGPTLRAVGADFQESFDGPTPTLQVQYISPTVELGKLVRLDAGKVGGCEQLTLRVVGDRGLVRIEHALPQCRVVDEFEISLWLKANRAGMTLAVRLMCPEEFDAETGEPLTLTVTGDAYEATGKWQQLRCRTSHRAVAEKLQLLRAKVRKVIDPASLLVDRILLASQVDEGEIALAFDDLVAGPIVRPDHDVKTPVAERLNVDRPAAEFRLDRLMVEGRPFFPRVVTHQGETGDVVAQAGMNLAWLPSIEQEQDMASLRAAGVWCTATPPRARDDLGATLGGERAGLMPFRDETAPILLWMLGARIEASHQPQLVDWIGQLQGADRRLRRPFAADVIGHERVFSRHLDLVGFSRHVLQTTMSLREYRDWLADRRIAARAGTFCFTWLQGEPAVIPELPALARSDGSSGMVNQLEPEQYGLEAYAALAAGFRGLGFWTTSPLDSPGAGANERRMALTQLNLELALLEPWLSTASSVSLASFTVQERSKVDLQQLRLPFGDKPGAAREREALLRSREDKRKSESRRERELLVAVMRTDLGMLLLPVWLEEFSQIVPGQLAASNVQMVVAGADESASAFEVSTTGVRSVPRERVTGGLKISLSKLDQSSAILVTSDRTLVEQLQRRAMAMQASSAEMMVGLARSKLRRTTEVDGELQQLGVGQPDGPQLVASARSALAEAEQAFGKGDFQTAKERAQLSRQFCRILQRAHWDEAVAPLSSPASSPYTLSFQTLPDHWRLVSALGRGSSGELPNLLPSGAFEDVSSLLTENWQHQQAGSQGSHSTAELISGGKVGNYCLRLAATKKESTDDKPADPPQVTVVSPPITISNGHVVHISGWARFGAPVSEGLDGALVFDSLLGKAGAVRLSPKPDWQRFELLRPAGGSESLTVTFALGGLGEVLFDDVRVVVVNLNPVQQTGGQQLGNRSMRTGRDGGRMKSQSFEKLPQIPRLPPLKRPKADGS